MISSSVCKEDIQNMITDSHNEETDSGHFTASPHNEEITCSSPTLPCLEEATNGCSIDDIKKFSTTPSLGGILSNFNSMYKEKLRLIEEAGAKKDNATREIMMERKSKVLESWAKDLCIQNMVLVHTLEELEREADTKVETLQKKISESTKMAKEHIVLIEKYEKQIDWYIGENISVVKKNQKLQNNFLELEKKHVRAQERLSLLEKDNEYLISLICRVRDMGVWDVNGLYLHASTYDRIFGLYPSLAGSEVKSVFTREKALNAFKLEQLEETIEELKQVNEDTTQQLTDNKELVSTLQADVDKLSSKVKYYKEESEQHQASLERTRQLLKHEAEVEETALHRANAALAAKDREMNSLLSDLRDLKSHLKNASDDKQQTELEAHNLKEELTRRVDELQEMTKLLHEAQSEAQSSQAAIESSQSQESHVESLKNEVEYYETQYNKAQLLLSTKDDLITSLQKQMNLLQDKVNDLDRRNQDLENRVNKDRASSICSSRPPWNSLFHCKNNRAIDSNNNNKAHAKDECHKVKRLCDKEIEILRLETPTTERCQRKLVTEKLKLPSIQTARREEETLHRKPYTAQNEKFNLPNIKRNPQNHMEDNTYNPFAQRSTIDTLMNVAVSATQKILNSTDANGCPVQMSSLRVIAGRRNKNVNLTKPITTSILKQTQQRKMIGDNNRNVSFNITDDDEEDEEFNEQVTPDEHLYSLTETDESFMAQSKEDSKSDEFVSDPDEILAKLPKQKNLVESWITDSKLKPPQHKLRKNTTLNPTYKKSPLAENLAKALKVPKKDKVLNLDDEWKKIINSIEGQKPSHRRNVNNNVDFVNLETLAEADVEDFYKEFKSKLNQCKDNVARETIVNNQLLSSIEKLNESIGPYEKYLEDSKYTGANELFQKIGDLLSQTCNDIEREESQNSVLINQQVNYVQSLSLEKANASGDTKKESQQTSMCVRRKSDEMEELKALKYLREAFERAEHCISIERQQLRERDQVSSCLSKKLDDALCTIQESILSSTKLQEENIAYKQVLLTLTRNVEDLIELNEGLLHGIKVNDSKNVSLMERYCPQDNTNIGCGDTNNTLEMKSQ